jgi:DNA-binding transcriptional LysR family regulator
MPFTDLDLRHLLAFEAVAAEGTFGRAAERLGYTQSAVSQQIAALERVLGDRVFDRPGGPRPVEVTPFGALLLGYARDVLARARQADDALERFRRGETGRVAVGTFQSVSTSLLPAIVGRLRVESPDVEIVVHESDEDAELESLLTDGTVDLTFWVGHVHEQHDGVELVADPFVLLAPHGEFADGPVPPEVLHRRPLIGQQNSSSCQRMNESSLRALGLDLGYVFRTNDNGTVAAMVQAGMGLAVLPRLCIDPHESRVAVHELDPPIPDRLISLVWRRGRTMSPSAVRFAELAREVAATVQQRLETGALA